jgi:hypothetical protein
MNKTAIKNYAQSARKNLIRDISLKMRIYGISEDEILTEDEFLSEIAAKNISLTDREKLAREALARRVELHGFAETAEEVAYTWFNRFIALRYMEINGVIPIRVLSSTDSNRLEPDALRECERLDYVDQDIIAKLKTENTDKLYRYILISECRSLQKSLPEMFTNTSDYTELLLPDRLYTLDSCVYDLTHGIDESDFDAAKNGQVEIIGWLYQYYISEKKDEVFKALKKNVKISRENIPAATQLFTPDWIVRYMVENSLGRIWLVGHPDSPVRANWKYYIDSETQAENVENAVKSPEEIRVIDPCMGSGHVLVYAFEVLYQIYESVGYAERDIPNLILTKNLYGLDIDPRARQLTYFALMMKAREKNRRFLRQTEMPHPNVYATFGDADLEEYGSALIVSEPPLPPEKSDNMLDITSDYPEKLNAYKCREILSQKYDAVITNPPYMGASGMGVKLSDYVKKNYPDSKSDLFAVFIEACARLTKPRGYQAMITQHAWMFLSSYEKLRQKLLQNHDIVNMAHLGARAFEEIGGEVVQTTSFVMKNEKTPGFAATFARLVDANSQQAKEEMFLRGENRFVASEDNFKKIPGTIIAYWVSNKFIDSFNNIALGDIVELVEGIHTRDNDRFLRLWHEIDFSNSSLIDFSLRKKWYGFNKGGLYRQWFGNNEYVINWAENGKDIKNFEKSTIGNCKHYFEEGITYTTMTSGVNSFRFSPQGNLYDTAGPTLYPVDKDNMLYLLGLLCSKVSNYYYKLFKCKPGLEIGQVKQLPILFDESKRARIEELVKINIEYSRNDWDSFERSWNFQKHPLVESAHSVSSAMIEPYGKPQSWILESAYEAWEWIAETRFEVVKRNEEELNRIFIDIYGLQDELSPEVDEKDVTVRKADLVREVKSLISYAVGCMFGRYSLDEPGLVYAGGEFDIDRYKTFRPAENNIIPINDIDYFDDDIGTRIVEFLKKVYGENTLDRNVEFVANTLYPGQKGSAVEKIRRYFLNDFYKDHLKIYQKKPIYWMFDSGKNNGFKALTYMHRYTKYTAGIARSDYLHPLQQKYDGEIKRLSEAIKSPEIALSDRTEYKKRIEIMTRELAEARAYDMVIAHIALMTIDIDLDDGVTKNYAKFQNVEIPQDNRDPVRMDLFGKIS